MTGARASASPPGNGTWSRPTRSTSTAPRSGGQRGFRQWGSPAKLLALIALLARTCGLAIVLAGGQLRRQPGPTAVLPRSRPSRRQPPAPPSSLAGSAVGAAASGAAGVANPSQLVRSESLRTAGRGAPDPGPDRQGRPVSRMPRTASNFGQLRTRSCRGSPPATTRNTRFRTPGRIGPRSAQDRGGTSPAKSTTPRITTPRSDSSSKASKDPMKIYSAETWTIEELRPRSTTPAAAPW